jgi:hypothetical protein
MSTPHTSRHGVGQPAPATAKAAIAGCGLIRTDPAGTGTQLSGWAEAPA